MTTLNTIGESVTPAATRNSSGLLDRLVDWMNHVVDALFGPSAGEGWHGHPAETYLFLNPSGCGAGIDSNLWDLLNDQRPQPETKEGDNA